MEVMSVLNELEDMIESSKGLFGNKASIDKGRALELIQDIRISLPDDFKQAEWISQERQQIIYHAEDEAKRIVEEATLEAERLVEAHEITQKAYERGQSIVQAAEDDARELRNGAIRYSQGIMEKIAAEMRDIHERVMSNHDELQDMLIPERPEEDD